MQIGKEIQVLATDDAVVGEEDVHVYVKSASVVLLGESMEGTTCYFLAKKMKGTKDFFVVHSYVGVDLRKAELAFESYKDTSELMEEVKNLNRQYDLCGLRDHLTCKVLDDDRFLVNFLVSNGTRSVYFDTLDEMDTFVQGYSLGRHRSSLMLLKRKVKRIIGLDV